jgi:uncharacterized SAM-binding protein YcdF (DUF218 family)
MLIEILRLVGRVTDPSALLCLAILASAVALIARRRRLALMLQGAATAMVVLIGLLPGGVWLALPLETRFPVNPPLPDRVAGIVALGGTERLAQSEAWGQPTLSDPTPIAALLALGRRYPDAKMVFTGGSAPPYAGSLSESQIVREFLLEMGAAGDRIVYEPRSRNTLENALFTRDLVHPNPREVWILVGQAISLPRAVAVFRHTGWNVIPFPAGYITDGKTSVSGFLRLESGLSLSSSALHEWGGLLAYRLMGYTDDLFPR